MKPLSNFDDFFFNITDCNEWYMYQFTSNTTSRDKNFFGHNQGFPLVNPYQDGMLSKVLSVPCKEINKTVPYFEEANNNETINQYIYRQFLDNVMKHKIDLNDRVSAQKGLEMVPDGTIEIKRSDEKQLLYKMSVNDKMYYSYHRNNGVTKLGIIDKS